MTKTKSFGIVGGGIGGLTLAIALRQKGFEARVYENAPAFKPLGAGIVLAANAIRAFQALGIEKQIIEAGKQLKKFTIRDASGSVLSSTSAEKVSRKFGVVNTLSLHRADLHQVLVNNLSPSSLLLNKGCARFESLGPKVRLHFHDGSTADEDYVVAADGINSVFRKQLLPNIGLRYSGYTCWRAVTHSPEDIFHDDEACETWGRGKRFGIVPLRDGRIYWYATVNAAQNDKKFSQFNIQELKSLFENFHAPVALILAQTNSLGLIKNDICDTPPLRNFAFGNIVLLGDAAHATTPNLGQGACMAIEDAVVLGNCIDQHTDPVMAFKTYEQRRLKRVNQIVTRSYNLGRIAQITNPLLIQIRNAALRWTPESIADKQIDFLYDVSFS